MKHPLQFDESTVIDSSRYGRMGWLSITNIFMVLFFLLVWPILRLLDRKYRRKS